MALLGMGTDDKLMPEEAELKTKELAHRLMNTPPLPKQVRIGVGERRFAEAKIRKRHNVLQADTIHSSRYAHTFFALAF